MHHRTVGNGKRANCWIIDDFDLPFFSHVSCLYKVIGGAVTVNPNRNSGVNCHLDSTKTHCAKTLTANPHNLRNPAKSTSVSAN